MFKAVEEGLDSLHGSQDGLNDDKMRLETIFAIDVHVEVLVLRRDGQKRHVSELERTEEFVTNSGFMTQCSRSDLVGEPGRRQRHLARKERGRCTGGGVK